MAADTLAKRHKADPILIEQKNLINMAECVRSVQDNVSIIRNRSRNVSLSVSLAGLALRY